jgi:hypothetical protein
MSDLSKAETAKPQMKEAFQKNRKDVGGITLMQKRRCATEKAHVNQYQCLYYFEKGGF